MSRIKLRGREKNTGKCYKPNTKMNKTDKTDGKSINSIKKPERKKINLIKKLKSGKKNLIESVCKRLHQ